MQPLLNSSFSSIGALLCCPLVTMRSVSAVVLALAAFALGSADPDVQRPRHDSNLEICILLIGVQVRRGGGGIRAASDSP